MGKNQKKSREEEMSLGDVPRKDKKEEVKIRNLQKLKEIRHLNHSQSTPPPSSPLLATKNAILHYSNREQCF